MFSNRDIFDTKKLDILPKEPQVICKAEFVLEFPGFNR